jgi:CBS domain-containing protein
VSTVEDYMSTKLVICDLQSSIFELAKVMVDSNVSSVAIIEEKGGEGEEQVQDDKRVVVGILTERDIIRGIAKGGRLDNITVGSMMSTSPILSVRKGQPIEEAALLMIRNKVRHLLVEDSDNNNSTTGIITTTDLARYLQKRMKEDSIVTASVGEESKEQQREGQDKQEQSSHVSSEGLLSEVWELYF